MFVPWFFAHPWVQVSVNNPARQRITRRARIKTAHHSFLHHWRTRKNWLLKLTTRGTCLRSHQNLISIYTNLASFLFLKQKRSVIVCWSHWDAREKPCSLDTFLCQKKILRFGSLEVKPKSKKQSFSSRKAGSINVTLKKVFLFLTSFAAPNLKPLRPRPALPIPWPIFS